MATEIKVPLCSWYNLYWDQIFCWSYGTLCDAYTRYKRIKHHFHYWFGFLHHARSAVRASVLVYFSITISNGNSHAVLDFSRHGNKKSVKTLVLQFSLLLRLFVLKSVKTKINKAKYVNMHEVGRLVCFRLRQNKKKNKPEIIQQTGLTGDF